MVEVCGRLRRGARTTGAGRRQALEEGDDSSLANILLNRVILETWAGEIAVATELAEHMVEAFAQQGVPTEGANVWQAFVDAFAGRLGGPRGGGRGRPTEPIVAAIWGRAVGLAELAAGEAEAPNRRLSEALDRFDRIDFREPAIWRVDGDTIEAALCFGDTGRATCSPSGSRNARSVRASPGASPSRHAAGGCCTVPTASSSSRSTRWSGRFWRTNAARCLSSVGAPCSRLASCGGDGRSGGRRAGFEEALALFDDRLLPWGGACAGGARAGAGAPRRRADATEEAIAGLAASGLTNKLIAERVFVSPKTVESNLARVYRKLGIAPAPSSAGRWQSGSGSRKRKANGVIGPDAG